LIGLKGKWARAAFLIGILPFVIMGWTMKSIVLHDSQTGWNDQKQIWQEIFRLAPDLSPGTHVLLLLPDYGENFYGAAPFIGGPIFFGYGLNLFYGNSDLAGHFINGDLNTPIYSTDTISLDYFSDLNDVTVPYSNALLFIFDKEHGQLIRIPEIPDTFTFQKNGNTALCPNCILTESTQHTELRWLVK
jgi:hypothetical protein